MKPLARVEQETHGDVPLAAIAGEIDASNSEAIGERLRSMLTNRSEALVVDLTETTYLDSAGINLLFELGAELRQRQQRLHVVIAEGSRITRVTAITGLDGAMPVHATREAALRDAAAPSR